jgi:hypothetical protein
VKEVVRTRAGKGTSAQGRRTPGTDLFVGHQGTWVLGTSTFTGHQVTGLPGTDLFDGHQGAWAPGTMGTGAQCPVPTGSGAH